MISLGTQYYRPPFPASRFWKEDLHRIRDAGLNTLQLWVLWGWVEPEPGQFRFDDYDELVSLAGEAGLNLVLSTIAEIQPLWIHRIVPGSEMISTSGEKILSGCRNECHFGLTPGGCTDHPEVWSRMARFLDTVARRYRDLPNLHGWDAWNELRWNVHADDIVCCCEHTLRAWHAWLDRRHGGLEGLNRAWQTRYACWEDVRPEKKPGRPFTLNMSFCHFLTCRADEHARQRYAVLKGADPAHPVTLHGGSPSAGYAGSRDLTPLDRGNDWFFADALDGVGCSSFPKWFGIDDADFGIRIEFVKSAARGKQVWLSELQGGRAATGFDTHTPVDAASQQRWIWNGLACGADTVLFWCWRDEVFCREAGGFGLVGLDGLADERIAAMKVTGRAIDRHGDLLRAYVPAKGDAAVLFSPQTYYHHWATESAGRRAEAALMGYARALVRCSVPYVVVEEAHLEALDGVKLLFLPRVTVLSPELEAALEAFVRAGGTLVCESECGAFTPEGVYRYPEERLVARLTGRAEVGRRALPPGPVEAVLDGRALRLDATQWLTPLRPGPGTNLAVHPDGALVADVPVGCGRVICCGAFLGEEYYRRQRSAEPADKANGPAFESLVAHAVRVAGCRRDVEILEPAVDADRFLYVKTGLSGSRRLVFVFFQEGHARARLRFPAGSFTRPGVSDLLSDQRYAVATSADGAQELTISMPDRRFAVLAEDAG